MYRGTHYMENNIHYFLCSVNKTEAILVLFYVVQNAGKTWRQTPF